MTPGVVSCALAKAMTRMEGGTPGISDNATARTDITGIAHPNLGRGSFGWCQGIWQRVRAAFPAVKGCEHERACAIAFEAVGSSFQLPNTPVSLWSIASPLAKHHKKPAQMRAAQCDWPQWLMRLNDDRPKEKKNVWLKSYWPDELAFSFL